ncbi:hypothetical protein FRC17_004499 [Serendipita sp. 399]|nr:hypothetical protein FRC17_004499 [Serendipita sp. 399]
MLPPDFPKHLLLRICEAILEPLLNPALPLKPYSRPWTRNQPSPWHVAHSPELAIEASESKAVPSTNWARMTRIASSAKGSTIVNCKSDCLSFASCNRRMWIICQDTVHMHIRVSNLAIADILVSRRNILRNTRVLEIYITREVEASQAQSDLNLSRFFIQAGVLLLWSPRINTVIIDLKAIPGDAHIWASFISRLRQRLFIVHLPGSFSATSPPMIQEPEGINTVAGVGQEKSTSWDMNARWGDSQGLINSPEKVAIPHLALSLGYTAAGDISDGLGGALDALFSAPLPRNSELHNPSGMLSSTPSVAPSRLPRTFDTLTALDLSIPRPTWGHEESEGHALGLKLRRLTSLKRLSLHADGGMQNNSSNAEFGLMRKPPFPSSGVEIETDVEADMSIHADGTVLYPAKNSFQSTHYSSPPTTSRVGNNPRGGGGVGSSYTAGHSDGGYGPETWWTGVFYALSLQGEDDNPANRLPPQSIEELRISVSVPGGHVELAHFDAFYATVVSYFRRMTTLQDLIFDMSFSTPQEESFLSRARNDSSMISHFERQKYYVEWLTDSTITQIPLITFKPELVPRHSEPRNFLSTMTPIVHVTNHPITYDHSDQIDIDLEEKDGALARSTARIPHRKDSEEGKVSTPSLRHVYFGEYHGLPMMPPSDWEYNHSSIPSQKPLPPAGEPGKPSGASPLVEIDYAGAKGKRPKGIDGAEVRIDGAVVVHSGRGVGGSARGNVSDGRTRTLPGMWWTIGSPEKDAVKKRVIVQGWKEAYEMETVSSSSWIDFPKSFEGRVYHLGIRAGELASRIITVGDPARARTIARYLDPAPASVNGAHERQEGDHDRAQSTRPLLFELYSERGFLTLTGKYKGVPVSIVSIGMGAPNMDFFVREAREVLDEAGEDDMLASIAVTRNYDYEFLAEERTGEEFRGAYHLSRPVGVDEELHSLLLDTLRENLPSSVPVIDEYINASADSFYSSQGRITSFPDHNEGLIDHLVAQNIGSLEKMETFHLLHLAANWPRPGRASRSDEEANEGDHGVEHGDIGHREPPPLTSIAVEPLILPSSSFLSTDITKSEPFSSDYPPDLPSDDGPAILHPPTRKIRAAAVQMIFAERTSRAFISPQEVAILQEGSARGLLETLVKWRATHRTHPPS